MSRDLIESFQPDDFFSSFRGSVTQPIFLSWTGIHVPKLDEILRYDAERFPLIPQRGNCIGRGWGDSRTLEAPTVVSAQAARLPKVLEAAANNGADIVFIDTAPHSETAALAAIRAADLILIPCRPAILDLRAISDSIDLVNLAKKTATVVLNAVPPRGSSASEATLAIATYEVAVAPIQVGQRAAFVHSLTAGQTAQEYEPNGRAAEEIQQLYKWMCKQVKI